MTIGSGIASQIGIAEELYVNEVQQFSITGAPTGGTFALIFDGAQTAPIAFNAASAAVQAALALLPNIGAGGVTCGGGALPATPVTITFGGTPLTAKRNVPQVTADLTLLTGGAPVFAPATNTGGTGYGDYVAPTRFLEFVDENFLLDIQRVETKGIRSGNRVLRTDRWYANKKGAAGDLDFEVSSKGFGLVLKYLLGALAITTPANGVLTRKQTATLADPAGASLTVQAGRPDTFGTVRPVSYVGGKVNTWELIQELDAILMLKMGMDFKDEDTTQSLGAATYAAAFEQFHFGGCQVQIAGANVDLRKFDLKADLGLKTDRYFLRGDTRKKEPIVNALAPFTGSLEAEFNDLTLYNRFVTGTVVPLVATWTGSLIETVAAPGPYNFKLVCTLNNVRFDGQSPDAGGPDIILQTLPFTVLYDGTNGPVTFDYFTTDTAA